MLSNFINSGILSIYVVTQFKAQSLLEHLDRGWRTTDFLGDHFVTPVPAQMRSGEDWYQGTADCVYQNLYLLERHNPKLVAVFGADHIYRMNVRQMIDEHQKKSADVTVAALPVRIEEASQFGVIKVDSDWRIIGFDEKPKNPKSIPGEPNYALVSMGNYLFNNEVLIASLNADAEKPASTHDFARDILPGLIQSSKIFAYDFRKNRVPIPSKGEEPSYWRDLGTIDAYYESSMDLCSIRHLIYITAVGRCVRSATPIRRRNLSSTGKIAKAWRSTRSSPRARSSAAAMCTTAWSEETSEFTATARSKIR